MSSIRRIWGFLKEKMGYSFFHPQYLTLRFRKDEINFLKKHIKGVTLDIGSGSQWYKNDIMEKIDKYIALDYPPTSKLYEETYGKKPHIYGNVMRLGIKDSSIDSVLFLDVIEHVDNPEEALKEIYRILKKEGVLCFSAPFLYPIHDTPYDYKRWTIFGIESMLSKNNFEIVEYVKKGNFWTVWGIFLNLRQLYVLQDLIEIKSHFKWILILFFIPFVFIFSLTINLISSILEKIDHSQRFTLGYTVIAKKR